MGFVGSLLGVVGFFGIGIPIGLLLGYFGFIYFEPRDVKGPITRPLLEFDSNSLIDILPELPQWIMNPDYEKVDWMNQFVLDIWPYLDKAVCGIIESTAKPIFAEYVGKFGIKSIGFKRLTLGKLPLKIQGVKVLESNEKQLLFDLVFKWAGNPDIVLGLKILAPEITVQLIDIQVSASVRVILKPLVPTFPCFANILVSLMQKPDIDFGLKVMGADIMAIPGLYRYVQEYVRKEVARSYLWPQTYELPILDSSVGAVKKPVGILHVKVIRALRLLNKDLFSKSDPYVQLSLSGERLPAKKTSVKMDNLNPEWNEDFKLTVKDPESQVLELHLYDWEQVGAHDKLGIQIIPLKLLKPYEKREFTLDLLHSMNPNDLHNKKPRGQLIVELNFIPFLEDSKKFTGSLLPESSNSFKLPKDISLKGAGLLLVGVIGAKDVEGKNYTNPHAMVLFRGEQRRTKTVKKSRNPRWDEEFQFVLEEAPLKDHIHIEVMSKRRVFGLWSKESLGYVDINLMDVIYNGRINEEYHLINSKDGVIHVDVRWKAI